MNFGFDSLYTWPEMKLNLNLVKVTSLFLFKYMLVVMDFERRKKGKNEGNRILLQKVQVQYAHVVYCNR